jgi:type I restriction enzyme S subunit
LVTGKHIVNGFINFSECYLISPGEHAKVIRRSKPEKGDIIFSNIGTLGSVVLVDQDFE